MTTNNPASPPLVKKAGKAPLATDDALFGSGFSSSVNSLEFAEKLTPDEFNAPGRPLCPSRPPRPSPAVHKSLAEPIYTFRSIGNSLFETEEEAIIDSYNLLLDKAVDDIWREEKEESIRDANTTLLREAMNVIKSYPYIAKLLGERAELTLTVVDTKAAKKGSAK